MAGKSESRSSSCAVPHCSRNVPKIVLTSQRLFARYATRPGRKEIATRNRKGPRWFLSLAIVALTACSPAPPPAGPPPKVSVVTLQATPVPITTELPGRVAAFRIADVRPQVNGIILKRFFVEGSEVKAGQQLYQIDPAPYQASYDSAVAADVSARALWERYKPLAEANAVSKQDYDN